MKFICSTVINLSIDKTVALWQDENSFDQWQDGFLSIDFFKGEKNQINSVRKIRLKQGKGEMLLTETILENRLPDVWKTFVHHEHMDNNQTVRFSEIDKNTTKIESEIEYLEFRHFLPRIMAKFFPALFRKQVQKWLDQFKVFAESKNALNTNNV